MEGEGGGSSGGGRVDDDDHCVERPPSIIPISVAPMVSENDDQ